MSLVTETIRSGDNRWLGSTHGIANARTGNLDISAFTEADHYPNGYIPSGTPVSEAADKSITPYADGGQLAGFILFDQAVKGDENINVPVLDHGRVIVEYLPVEDFTPPTPENDKTTFVYETEAN